MRSLSFLLFIAGTNAIAQPDPPRITFALADTGEVVRPLTRAHRVEMSFRERNWPTAGVDEEQLWQRLPTTGASVFGDTITGWRSFAVMECLCRDLHVLVIAGSDTMRLVLPNSFDDPHGETLQHLVQRAWSRWDRNTPEVIRFRPGTFVFSEVIADTLVQPVVSAIVARLKAEEDARYQKLVIADAEWRRTHPPTAPEPPPGNRAKEDPPVAQPKAPMTQAEFEKIAATWGGLKKLELEQDTVPHDSAVVVHITGRIMLNGDCGSLMPLFGVDMLTDTGWEELLPFDPTQMCCGMPWVEWKRHAALIPLAWWVKANSREGKRDLVPGTYRLVFAGRDTKRMRTEAFVME